MKALNLLFVIVCVFNGATLPGVSTFGTNETIEDGGFIETGIYKLESEGQGVNRTEDTSPLLVPNNVDNRARQIISRKGLVPLRKRRKLVTQTSSRASKRLLRHRKVTKDRKESHETERLLLNEKANLSILLETKEVSGGIHTFPDKSNLSTNLLSSSHNNSTNSSYSEPTAMGKLLPNDRSNFTLFSHDSVTLSSFDSDERNRKFPDEQVSRTDRLKWKEADNRQIGSIYDNRKDYVTEGFLIMGRFQRKTEMKPVTPTNFKRENLNYTYQNVKENVSDINILHLNKFSADDARAETETPVASVVNFTKLTEYKSNTKKPILKSEINSKITHLIHNIQSDAADPSFEPSFDKKPLRTTGRDQQDNIGMDSSATNENVTDRDNRSTKNLSAEFSEQNVSSSTSQSTENSRESIGTTVPITSKRRTLLHKIRHQKKHKLERSDTPDTVKQLNNTLNETVSNNDRHTFNVFNFYGPVIITDNALNSPTVVEFLRNIAGDTARRMSQAQTNKPSNTVSDRDFLTESEKSPDRDLKNIVIDFSNFDMHGSNESTLSAGESYGYDQFNSTESGDSKVFSQSNFGDAAPGTDEYGNFSDNSEGSYNSNQNGPNSGIHVSDSNASSSFDQGISSPYDTSGLNTNYQESVPGSAMGFGNSGYDVSSGDQHNIGSDPNYGGSSSYGTGTYGAPVFSSNSPGYGGSVMNPNNMGSYPYYGGSSYSTGSNRLGSNVNVPSSGSNNMDQEKGWKIRGHIRFGTNVDEARGPPNMPPTYDSSQWRYESYPYAGVPSNPWQTPHYPHWNPYQRQWSPPYASYDSSFQHQGRYYPYPGMGHACYGIGGNGYATLEGEIYKDSPPGDVPQFSPRGYPQHGLPGAADITPYAAPGVPRKLKPSSASLIGGVSPAAMSSGHRGGRGHSFNRTPYSPRPSGGNLRGSTINTLG